MHRKQLLTDLLAFKAGPFIAQDEHTILEHMVDFVENSPDCFDRHHKGHVTGSAWIVSDDLSKALLTHHRKYNIWLQLGGHADGNPDIKSVAYQEAFEESGIKDLELLTPDIYDIGIHPVPNRCTYHYDISYLIKAPRNASYKVSSESHDLAWVALEEVYQYSTKRSVLRMVEKVSLIKMI